MMIGCSPKNTSDFLVVSYISLQFADDVLSSAINKSIYLPTRIPIHAY